MKPSRNALPRRNESCYSRSRCSETSQRHGLVAEWLRRGLQILAPRFDSGRGLQFRSRRRVATRRHERERSDHGAGNSRRRICGAPPPYGRQPIADLRRDRSGGARGVRRCPRETFVAPAMASLAYLDRDVPALGGGERLLLAPMILAKLIQAANVRAGEKALDVAGGSGYSAAILAALGAQVVALESDAGAVAAAKTLLGAIKIDRVRRRRLGARAPRAARSTSFSSTAPSSAAPMNCSINWPRADASSASTPRSGRRRPFSSSECQAFTAGARCLTPRRPGCRPFGRSRVSLFRGRKCRIIATLHKFAVGRT